MDVERKFSADRNARGDCLTKNIAIAVAERKVPSDVGAVFITAFRQYPSGCKSARFAE